MVSISMLPQDPPSPKQDAGAPEPNALPTEAADNIEMPLPSSPQTFFLGSLLSVFSSVSGASLIARQGVGSSTCDVKQLRQISTCTDDHRRAPHSAHRSFGDGYGQPYYGGGGYGYGGPSISFGFGGGRGW